MRAKKLDVPTIAAGLFLGVTVGTLLAWGVRRWRGAKRHHHSSAKLDDSLDATYPASDPPASQFYGIPSNRL